MLFTMFKCYNNPPTLGNRKASKILQFWSLHEKTFNQLWAFILKIYHINHTPRRLKSRSSLVFFIDSAKSINCSYSFESNYLNAPSENRPLLNRTNIFLRLAKPSKYLRFTTRHGMVLWRAVKAVGVVSGFIVQ